MDDRTFFHDQLSRAISGGAWHGPALCDALADVTAIEAWSRRVPGVRTIGEITFHATSWIEEVTERLGGAVPKLPRRGDWPAEPVCSEDDWRALLDRLDRARAALLTAIDAFEPSRFDDTVGSPEPDAPLGTGVSYAAMLSGLAQHTAYHAGQIVLIKRSIRQAQAVDPA